jgi:magnesium-transporting ATPase (P-type)
MATGDNILTAICVSKECNLINQNQEMVACEIENVNGVDHLKWIKLEGDSNNEININKVDDSNNEIYINKVDDINDISKGDLNRNKHLEDNTPNTLHDLFPPQNISSVDMKNEDKKKEIKKKKQKPFQNDIKVSLSRTLSIASFRSKESNMGKLIIDETEDPRTLCNNDTFGIATTGLVFERLYLMNERYNKSKVKDSYFRNAHDAFRLILKNGRVFARMAPEHKALLVEGLKSEGFTTLMCGDGANDCSALKTAHVSVSLSAEEASIAANFTSKNPDVSCIYELLREGKCSLTTSIQTFKYMMLYSMIQFICVTLMMIYITYMSDFQFLVSDLFIIFPLEWFLAMTKPYDHLTHHYPIASLISFPVMTSILVHSVIVFAFQFGGYQILKQHYGWENICDFDDNDSPLPCHENTIYFLLSLCQYLGLAIAFFVSKPFRQRIYTNWLLMLYLAGAYFYSIWITINCDSWSKDLFDLYDLEKRGDFEEEEEEDEGGNEDTNDSDNDEEEEPKEEEEEEDDDDEEEEEGEEEDDEDDIIEGGKKMKYYILIMAGVNTVVNILFEWVFMRLINNCYESVQIKNYRKEIEQEKLLLQNNQRAPETKDVEIYKYQRVYYYDRRKK